MRVITTLCLLLTGAATVIACQSHSAPSPAVLVDADDDAMTVLNATLADAMGRANVELGPGDLAANSEITVLPPPVGPGEDRSLATPTYFDLMLVGDRCVVVHRDTAARYALDGVSCRPL